MKFLLILIHSNSHVIDFRNSWLNRFHDCLSTNVKPLICCYTTANRLINEELFVLYNTGLSKSK